MEARDRAARYLSQRSCSVEHMRRYLTGKGYEEKEIEETIKDLVEYGWLDDRKFAEQFMTMSLEKRRGMDRIRRELRQKGVSDEVIREAEGSLEDIPGEEQVASEVITDLAAIAREKDLTREEREKLRAKAARRLAGRGFSSSTVYRVVRKLI